MAKSRSEAKPLERHFPIGWDAKVEPGADVVITVLPAIAFRPERLHIHPAEHFTVRLVRTGVVEHDSLDLSDDEGPATVLPIEATTFGDARTAGERIKGLQSFPPGAELSVVLRNESDDAQSVRIMWVCATPIPTVGVKAK